MVSFAGAVALFLTGVSTVGAFAPGASFGVRKTPVQVRILSARVTSSRPLQIMGLVLLLVSHCSAFVSPAWLEDEHSPNCRQEGGFFSQAT